MKRWIITILSSVLVLANGISGVAVFAEDTPTIGSLQIGDYIQLGKYDDEPIIWRLMDEDAYGKLMVSDKILCEKPFGNVVNVPYDQKKSSFWKDSYIRAWLNSDVSEGEMDWGPYVNYWATFDIDVHEKGFLHESNFDALEKKVMKPVTQWTMLPQNHLDLTENGIDTAFNAIKKTIPGSPRDGGGLIFYDLADIPNIYIGAACETTDVMFLLDEMQVFHMYENLGDVKALCYDPGCYLCKFTGGYGTYSLRTPCEGGNTQIRYDGEYSGWVGFTNGIRPAFYLEEDNAMILSGSGTAEDPYVVTGREISVSVDGTEVAFDQSPIVRGGVVYAPLRAIAEQLGAAVSWDEAAQKVTVQMDGRTIDLTVDMQEMYVDGVMHWLPAPVILKGDRTLVPLQVLTDGFGLPAEWDSTAQTITITTAG